MKTIKTMILVLLSIMASAHEIDDLTAKQILESSISFCGGNQLNTIKSSESYYLLIQPDQSTAIINEKRKIGEKYVQSILSNEHTPQTTFFDGKSFSKVNGDSVVKIKNIQLVEEIKLKTYNQIQQGYKELNYKLTKMPDNKFENFDCFVIAAQSNSGYTTINFFDKTNFRLFMVVYPNGNKSLMIEYLFKDGILFNSHIVNTFVNSESLQVLKLQSVKINTSILDLWFNCPYDNKVSLPPQIKTGKFESTNGVKTVFNRTSKGQEYIDAQGKTELIRHLNWTGKDTYSLLDADTNSDQNILVRVISWDENGYVCHWIAGKYTDTQDYKIIK